MAQTKTTQIPILAGIRQDLSEKMAPPGTLTDALNVRFTAMGEVESRPGTVALSAASDADVGYSDALGTVGLLASSPGGFVVGTAGFGYRFDAAQARLHVAGSYANAEPRGVLTTIAREELTPDANLPVFPLSQARVNGYIATVYAPGGTSSNRALLKVFTEAGALVTSARIENVIGAMVVADGSNATDMALVTVTAATGDIRARVISTSSSGVTVGASASVGTLSAASMYWAPAYWPGIGWALAYQSAAAVMTVKRIAGTAVALTQTFAVTGTCPVSCYADATTVYVGVFDNATVARAYTFTTTLTASGPFTLETDASAGPPVFGPSLTASAANYVISRTLSFQINHDCWVYSGTMTAAGTVTKQNVVYECLAASAPFANGYVWVIAGGYNDTVGSGFNRLLLLDYMGLRTATFDGSATMDPVIALTGPQFVGAPSAGFAGGIFKQHLATPAQLSDGTWVAGLLRTVREESPGSIGLALAEWLKFATGGRRQAIGFGGDVMVAGFPTLACSGYGTRAYYDVTSTMLAKPRWGLDLGFPLMPAINVTTSNGAGSLTSSARYQWRVVIERIDAQGRRWRSAPSALMTATLGASDDTATVTGRCSVDWFRAGNETSSPVESQFVMHVYRSVANGQQLYRSTPPQGAPTAASAAGVFTFSDTISDDNLRTREFIYTDGGVLQNDAPPSCRFLAATEDRVWLAGLWESEQLQSSKILVPGEPPQFSDSSAFRVVLPEPCAGVAVQDGIVIAFTARAVYAIQGAGPNDQGQGAWESPRQISSGSGCIAAESIAVTAIGIFFQSSQGIELIPRGAGEPQVIGMAVQDLLRGASIVSAAVVTTFKSRTVRFVIDDASTGFVLTYDIDLRCWSRDTYPLAPAAIADTASGAVIATETLSNGYGFLRESESLDVDSSGNGPSEIASSLEWADLRPFGVAGQGRFHSAVGLFSAKSSPSGGYRAGNVTIKLSIDRFTEAGLTVSMSTALANQDYLRNAPKEDNGSSGALALTAAVAGWRFAGWTVEVDDHGGARRMGETEQG